MKKNYTLLICAFLLSTGLFAQTNLLLNPTFTSGDDWRGDAVGGCTGAEIGTYDSSETNTADGSGCWQINACDNNNNRLQSAAAFAVDMDNYTFTFYVKGTAGQVVTPWFFVTGSGNVLPVEGDYTIEATGVWEQVVRTHDIPAAANVTARIRLKTVNSSIKVDDVSLVLTSSIVDTTAPVITLLGDDTVTVEVGSVYTDAGATAIDNYDGDISSSIVTVNPVDTNTVGTYIITYNVSDVSGNVALEVTRTVNVVDTTLPVITLLGDNPVTIEVGSTYIDAGATATDTYDGDITSSIVTVSTVNTAIVGVYTVTYNVSDASGNTAAELIRTVNVEDTTLPVITLLGDNPVTIEVGSTYTDAGATATDTYDGDITSSIVTVSTVNTAIVGVYTVTYNVSDASGNTAAELTRTVNVVDTTVPVITLLGDNPVTIEVGSTYTDAGATAADTYDGDITSNIVTVSNVDTAIVGVYTVRYNVSDASGNAALEVTRTVNVVDTTVPVITLLGDNPVTIEVGSTYTDAGATATDTYDGDITSSIVTVSTVNTAIEGVYTVTYNVSDASGNAAVEVIRTVNVEDALSFENFEQIKFSLFPNPSTGDVTVMYYLPELMDGVSVEVYDMLGRLVWTQVIEQEQGMQQANLNLNLLQKGNYIVIISAGNNRGEKFVNNKIIILK